ncbi:MAG: alpha/beta hydrolase, partial [Solirubrobacteraceae bacterium]|nr:alpha/beta hydrolase [Solirubrobacteraceae bacterium]
MRTIPDLVYAHAGETPLALDLHLPADAAGPVPVALYLHGGGWTVGARTDRVAERIAPVVRDGVAVASASYRLTPTGATFPAQLHDVQAAIRWLRAHAAELGLRGERVGAWGASAGAHLALLAALTAREPSLDGRLGDHADEDRSLQAVVAWFPPVDLLGLEALQPGSDAPLPPFAASLPSPSFAARLLGAARVADAPGAARAASPLTWAAAAPDDCRFLLVHGDRDGLIPDSQSRLMHDALREHGARSELLLVADANHEDPRFDAPAVLGAVGAFL